MQHKANNYCDRNDLGNPGRWYRRTKDEDRIMGDLGNLQVQSVAGELRPHRVRSIAKKRKGGFAVRI